MNNKHPHGETDDIKHVNEEVTDKNEAEEKDDVNLYSIKIVDGEPVFVCNLCDEGLDNDELMMNNI